LKRTQQRFSALCFKGFFPQVHYCYPLDYEELKLHHLRIRRHHLDALFIIQVYLGSKLRPSVLEIVGVLVTGRYNRDFALFNASSSYKNFPSARCASAANIVCRDIDVFGAKIVLLNRIL
jgi:hypothetical protein